MSPLVSVVVPAYNTARYIREAIESVFSQTYGNFEVIVVNDGSPDTPELERALHPFLSRIRYFRRPHAGLSASRNFGIREARGQFISLLDSDDALEPDYLRVLMDLLRDSGLDIVFPDAALFGCPSVEGQTFMGLYPCRVDKPDFLSLVRRQCCVFIQVLARKEALLRAGLFDESLPLSEDFDMWLRCAKTGARFGYTKQVLGRYRRTPGSLSGQHYRMHAHNVFLLGRIARQYALSESEREVVRQERDLLLGRMAIMEAKRHLRKREYQLATERMAEAHRLIPSAKNAALVGCLRVAPSLVRLAMRLRTETTDTTPPDQYEAARGLVSGTLISAS